MLLLLHSLAIIAVFLLSVNIWIKLGLLTIVLSYGTMALLRYKHQPIAAIGYGENGWWCLQRQTRSLPNEKQWVTVLPSSVLTRWFISLHFRTEYSRQHYYLLLLVWQYTPAEYRKIARQLRVSGNPKTLS